MDFSCLLASQVVHYLYPLKPSIGEGKDHNLLQQIESPPIHLASLCTWSHFWHPWVGSIWSGGILKIWVWQWELWQDHDHPLNCQIQWFKEVSDYLFPARRHPHICKGSPLVAHKQSPNQCVKDKVNANQVVFSFLPRAFAPDSHDLIQSFSSWPL